MKIRQYGSVEVVCGEGESKSVRIAAENLIRDLRRVLDSRIDGISGAETAPDSGAGSGSAAPDAGEMMGGKKDLVGGGRICRIVVGTVEHSGEICRKAHIEKLQDPAGAFRREAYLIQEKDGELLIAGSDRRGTIYGIYEFCEKWLGVSPWYFFADVPLRKKREVEIPEGFVKADWPSVEYRGIFINDEEELEHWVQRYMGEPTIGVKTYEKIFELLLRLKLNYIWPAMHVNSFNAVRENGALAHEMGIVVGTSHCDMLMRSNNREWRPWLEKKGYRDVAYDFSLPGRNREILKEYWRESVEQNKDFEVSYTLGMRGIHDSGFEVRALKGKSGKELLEAKIELLESVIETQESLLAETLDRETVKTFVPYKEVLELYDNGLTVPEDLTLIWVNDNYGYVRRYPGEKEKSRKGGNGLYYHNSYWAPPGASYLFLCSIPLAHTRNELKKAYEEGIRKIWVTNFGAMKPLEQQISFYAAYAWEAGREGGCTEDEQVFLQEWIDRTFSGSYGKELAPILMEFDQVTNARKVEQMDFDAFSQTAYGDEAAGRIHRYEEMFDAVNRIWKALPRQEQDAFFQMVGMKIHAAYFTNLMYYYGDRSNLCMAQGKERAAQRYTELCRDFDHARRSMLYYYNHVMTNGKWNGILTPEDFPPPRTAMHPACMPPIGGIAYGAGAGVVGEPRDQGQEAGEIAFCAGAGVAGAQGDFCGEQSLSEISGMKPRRNVIVTVWNDEEEIVFTRPAVKWVELANNSEVPETCRLTGPDWLRFADSQSQKTECTVDYEARVLFEPDWARVCALLQDAELRQRAEERQAEELYQRAEERQTEERQAEELRRTAEERQAEELRRTAEGRQAEELRRTAEGRRQAEEPAPALCGHIRIEDSEGRLVRLIAVSVAAGSPGIGQAAKIGDAAEIRDAGEIRSVAEIRDVEKIRGASEIQDAGEIGDAAEIRDAGKNQDAREIRDMGDIRDAGENVEDDGRICVENLDCTEYSEGWRLIRNLGRDSGGLLEARKPGAEASWQITVLTPGSHLLELHRFPSLNSVGAIRVGVSVDQKEVMVLESESNDEHRGTWKENIRNNVDKLYLKLPYLEAGVHTIIFHAMSKYFAFGRFVIYTAQRKENSLGKKGGDQRLPGIFDVEGFVKDAYGKEAAALLPRPVYYLPKSTKGDSLAMEDIAIQPSCWGSPVKAEALVESGRRIFEEGNERVLIECASALAQSPYARRAGGLWRWCNSPSHGETGLAMYVRQAKRTWTEEDAPALCYRIRVKGGTYRIWVRAMMWGDDTAHFTISLDGERIPERELYGGRGIWRYSNEQVWKWIPVWEASLEEGEHELAIITFSARLRFEQIYITGGEELPPALG